MNKLLVYFLIVFSFYSCTSRNDNNATVSGDKSISNVEVKSEIGKNIDRYLSGMEALYVGIRYVQGL